MPKHKLSDAFLRGNRTPEEGQVDYWDTLTPGFGVRIGRGGRKSFQVVMRVNRRLRRFTLKPAYPLLSLADARHKRRRSSRTRSSALTRALARAMGAPASQHLRRRRRRLHARPCQEPAHTRRDAAQARRRAAAALG